MIHLIVGPSCAGKTSFVVNEFIHGQPMREFKDLITVTECDDCYLIGKYIVEGSRTKGTDRVSRKDIPKIGSQIARLIPKGKDIILEGDKICSSKLFDYLESTGEPCQLWWVRCSKEKSIERNRVNNSSVKEGGLKAVASKAENIFQKYCGVFNGKIIDTENVTDFTKVDTKHIVPISRKVETSKARDDFAVFILTHGRANEMATLKGVLESGGYTGKWYMILDNEDDQEPLYREKFGDDHVIVFDKNEVYKKIDTCDNFNEHRAIIYARNASYDIAKDLGLKYFLELDDDYTGLYFRYVENGQLKAKRVMNVQRLFDDMIEFLEKSDASTVAFCQAGDFLGGAQCKRFHEHLLRKAMNSFFCRTDRPVPFIGTINEDVTMYTTLGSRGEKIFSITDCAIVQKQTQKSAEGMSVLYLDVGTYIKSFYSVMNMPSAVKVEMMNSTHKRIHHKINWNTCVPLILNEKYRLAEKG